MSVIANSVEPLLKRFITQAHQGDLKTSSYPKEWPGGLNMKVSFGQGAAARIPWIALTSPEMSVSYGYYPVYLYYKDQAQLILAFGVSETAAYKETWPEEILDDFSEIAQVLGKVPRYGNSLIFKRYEVENQKLNTSAQQLDQDLAEMIVFYSQATNTDLKDTNSLLHQSMFHVEKQLEDFLVQNWPHTSLADNLDLIFEDGELKSQQYPTSVGLIDILAKNRCNQAHTVIELKKGQTSDDTVGQIARYMGWVKDNLSDPKVEGLIIARGIDDKLRYAINGLGSDHRISLWTYNIDFRLDQFGARHRLA